MVERKQVKGYVFQKNKFWDSHKNVDSPEFGGWLKESRLRVTFSKKSNSGTAIKDADSPEFTSNCDSAEAD